MNGVVTVNFKIFTGETNDVCVFEETQQVTVVDGLYSTLIGKNPTLGNIEESAKLDDAYLEVTVNGTKLKPREKFCPPAFAKKSEERWNLFFQGTVSPSSGFAIPAASFTFLAWSIGNLSPTNCYNQVGRHLMAVFPMPANSVRVASAKALISSNDVFWLHLELNPFIWMRVTARTLSQTVRNLGPDLVITPTNTPPFNSWFSLPLSTNQTDLVLQPSEFLCVEFCGAFTEEIPAGWTQECRITTNAPTSLLFDMRVK